MSETAPPIEETRVHKALGDPSRVKILELLRGTSAPLDATQLAEAVGLHANTVRSHLRILEDAGLVSAKPEERHRPGRPRLVYSATPEGITHEERAGYRLLAEILASHLASTAQDSDAQAEHAGQAWGRYLVGRRPPFSSGSPEEDVQAVVEILEQFGFAPEVEADDQGMTLRMQHCPFGEVADHYRKVVCSVHLGLMQGALEQLGAHLEADRLEPFVQPGVCAAHLERVPQA
jgi:predicted ArsR family transcriptional regulator